MFKLSRKRGFSGETVNALLLLDIKAREAREYQAYRKSREPRKVRGEFLASLLFLAPFVAFAVALASRLAE